jgi:hypothetical protein
MGAGVSGGLREVGVKAAGLVFQEAGGATVQDMKSGRGSRTHAGKSFTAIVRHIIRRPLLILVLLTIATVTTISRNLLPQPWDGLPYGFAMLAGVWSISRSLARSQAAQGEKPQD